MIIISKTPVRISFFGGGTDYPAFYLRKQGVVFGTSIDKYTYISINSISEFFDHKIRIAYSKTELVKTLGEIQHPSIRECLKHMGIFMPLDIHIFSDLPAKTGLGSSSSFTVGFLNSLYALQGKRASRQRLAEEACFVEQKLIRENVGSQDPFHAAFGGLNIITFDTSGISIRPVVISQTKKSILEDHMMLFYTSMTRFANEVVKEQIDKTSAKENDDYLARMYDIVFDAEKLLHECSEEELPQKFGELLDESWQLKKQLSSKISTQDIDAAYEKARSAGAYGGKLCGAGSGGFLLLMVPPEKRENVRKALLPYLEVKFRFENEGSSVIYMRD